jgi:TonB family protein
VSPSAIHALVVAGAAVFICGALLALLSHLRVPSKFFVWTLGAHIVFVALLGLTVAPKAVSRALVEDSTIEVALLPPIYTRPEEAPVVPEEAWVQPQTMQVVPPRELPTDQQGASVASRLLSDPSARDADARLRRIAPNMSSSAAASQGITRRTDEGLLIGSPTAPATAPLNEGASATPGPRRDVADRVGVPSPVRRPGDARVASPASSRAARSSLALPSGYQLTGEVDGRALKHLPAAPVSEGTAGGNVTISFVVAPSGRVQSTLVKRKAGSPLLERLAKEYAAGIQFAPLAAGVAQTTQRGEITVVFRKE